jgi:3-hydroxyisobutyrate dehydrogenase
VFLSVPDGAAVESVTAELLAEPDRRATTVIDLSTVGIAAADAACRECADAGVTYVDCPVSGGRAGAVAGTIAVMWAGPAELLETHRGALAAMAKNIFHVGDTAGQGQALKLLNNFLSATAMAATAEAVHFGMAQGLGMKTILDVVNVSTGESRSSREKYVDRILTGTFDSGFGTALMAKDVELYEEAVRRIGTSDRIGAAMNEIWRAARAEMPDSDHTEIFKFLEAE